MTKADAASSLRHVSPRRGALGLIVDPLFGTFFWGKVFSSAGVWVHSIVAAIVIFDTTGSALMVGMISVAQFGPQLFLSPLSGKWSDRGHARSQLIVGRAWCALGSGSIALWIWLDPDIGSATLARLLVFGSLLVGFGFAVGGPSMQAVIPSLIRPGELGVAMALNTAPMTTARIAGPALGAFAAAHVGAAPAFGFAACMHVLFALIIILMRLPVSRTQRTDVDYSIRAALHYVHRNRPLMLIACAAAGFGSEPSMTLAPAMADELGGRTGLVGELSAAFGAGAGVGLVLISTACRGLRSTVSLGLGLWLMVMGLAAVPLASQTWLALGAFAIAGFGFGWAMSGVGTLIQERAPDELRGRIMALWMVGFVGARPLAAAAIGAAADILTVRLSFLLTALLLAAVALLCRPRNLTDPVASAAPITARSTLAHITARRRRKCRSV